MPRAKVAASSVPKETANIIISTNNTVEQNKPKRRGRPPNKKNSEEKPAPKKRGRKPKGGQIIKNTDTNSNSIVSKENIIVHLKCSTALLSKSSPNNITSLYTSKSENTTNNLTNVNNITNVNNKNINYFNLNKDSMKVNTLFENTNIKEVETTNTNKKLDDEKKKRKQENEIFDKLKELQHNLKHEHICLTESNCFWCTCSFENPPIHIPKHIIKDTYHVYGCFCSPECATAFLFDENIDNATRFERYSLLCSLYTKIFKYDKNIKPAPNPFYTLDKFCGNLSIMEYRELFNSNRLLFVINKPITRDLPELDIVDSNIFN